jgi:hypothetical protein
MFVQGLQIFFAEEYQEYLRVLKIPSNALSSAMDLNFDTFFLMISSQGEQLSIRYIVTKGKLLLILFFSTTQKNYRDIQMHWYDMYQFCLLNKKVLMLGIAK